MQAPLRLDGKTISHKYKKMKKIHKIQSLSINSYSCFFINKIKLPRPMIRFLKRIIAKFRNLSFIFILVYKKKLNIGL